MRSHALEARWRGLETKLLLKVLLLIRYRGIITATKYRVRRTRGAAVGGVPCARTRNAVRSGAGIRAAVRSRGASGSRASSAAFSALFQDPGIMANDGGCCGQMRHTQGRWRESRDRPGAISRVACALERAPPLECATRLDPPRSSNVRCCATILSLSFEPTVPRATAVCVPQR